MSSQCYRMEKRSNEMTVHPANPAANDGGTERDVFELPRNEPARLPSRWVFNQEYDACR